MPFSSSPSLDDGVSGMSGQAGTVIGAPSHDAHRQQQLEAIQIREAEAARQREAQAAAEKRERQLEAERIAEKRRQDIEARNQTQNKACAFVVVAVLLFIAFKQR